MKYEYKVVDPEHSRTGRASDSPAKVLEEFVNHFASRGWRHKSDILSGAGTYFLFERELPEESPTDAEESDQKRLEQTGE